MALPELDVARVQRWCAARVPEHALHQVRVECQIAPRHLTIVERRAPWREEFGPEWTSFPIARLRYTAAALVNELVEAADDKTLSRTIARYGRVDLLCLDELGYLELDRRGAELLFQVFTEREERASIAIASNAAFSEWTSTFTDPRLCAAIVDCLTFAGQIIETGTTSYRLAHARLRRTAG